MQSVLLCLQGGVCPWATCFLGGPELPVAPSEGVVFLDARLFVCRAHGDGMSELIVVTIIVAAEGGARVPKITSREDLTKALNKLGALRSEQVYLDCMA